jgi:hypothetical protein
MDNVNIRNEEDVKIKIVLRFLEDLGFVKEELDAEMSFTIKMGRSVYRVDTGKEVQSANARLDILVKYQGKNLCIFEVKSDSVKISREDITQALTYGKLLNPVVPFCIITNGKDSIMLDTLSGKPLAKDDLKGLSVNGYSVTLPDDSYYEAVKKFFGYSEGNLLAFCKEQVLAYIRPLKGSSLEPGKKYIPEVYEPNEKLEIAFQDFLMSDNSCFVTVGNSGMGKSCWICNLAEVLIAQGQPVLFYRANDIKKGVFQTIADDLNWTLSPNFNAIQGMKRFFDIFETESVFILIDGLDEIDTVLARELMEDFLRRIQHRKVKFVATCKKEVWPRLLKSDDVPTLLSEVVHAKGYQLDELDDGQFYNMVEKYREFYNFSGLFQRDVQRDCKRNPFLLRVMFEVASAKQLEHFTYSSSEFYEECYRKIISRFNTRDSIESILIEIAKLLYDKNTDFVDVKEIRAALRLSPSEVLPTRLYELNILESREGLHSEEVGFYFNRFRDYLIAFRVLQLQRLSPADLLEYTVGITGMRRGIFELYYVLANEEHKRVIDGPLYQKALKYVLFYEEIINRHFPAFKKSFPPKTSGAIGFVGYFDIAEKQMGMNGFREVNSTEPKVLLIPDGGMGIFSPDVDNLAYLYGVSAGMSAAYSSTNYFLNLDVEKYVLGTIIPKELKRIIRSGRLNEDKSKFLLQEKLLAICYSHYPVYMGIDKKLTEVSLTSFPLTKLREAVLTSRASRILEDNLIQQKVKSGEIKTKRNGSSISYVASLSQAEKLKILDGATQIAKEGTFLTSNIQYEVDEFEQETLNAILLLEQMGEMEITDPFAMRRTAINEFKRFYMGQLIDTEFAYKYFDELLSVAFALYKNIIEENFPKLKKSFRFYAEFPISCFYCITEGRIRQLRYDLIIGKAQIGVKDNVTTIAVSSPQDINVDFKKEEFTVDSVKYKAIEGQGGNFNKLLSPPHTFSSFKSRGDLLSIRSLIYTFITNEIEYVLEQMEKSY